MNNLDSFGVGKIIRPSILPDDMRFVKYPFIMMIILSLVGLFIHNKILAILPLMILIVFPGLPLLFHSIFHLLVKIQIFDNRITVQDNDFFSSSRLIKINPYQEIYYDEIDYIYYGEKEVNIVINLKRGLKKYKISKQETDFRKQNIISKCNITEDILNEFKNNNQKLLNDNTSSGVFLILDDIFSKYNISSKTIKNINKSLVTNENFNFEYIKNILSEFPIEYGDLNNLKEEFDSLATPIVDPFLITKFDIYRYEKMQNNPKSHNGTIRSDNCLILSNKDGTKKCYLRHFHDLSNNDLWELTSLINFKNKDVKYLMSKKSFNFINNISQ